MFVTVGSLMGAGQCPNKGGTVVGNKIVSMLKGKHLFVKRAWTNNNQKFSWDEPRPDTTVSAKEIKLRNLSAALGISEEDAEEILDSSLPPVEHAAGETRT